MLAVLLLGFMAELAAGAAPPAKALDPKQLEQGWADLASGDPIQALAGLMALATEPESAVQLLKKRLKPVRGDQVRIDRWIADLDSPHFTARARASAELELVVDFAAPALRKALADQPSLELRYRLERVLETLRSEGEEACPHRVQAVRAIALLEYIGSEEARRQLKALATGDDASPTHAARAALQRLSERPAKPSDQQLTADLHGEAVGPAARAFLILARGPYAPQPAEAVELLYLMGRAPATDPFAQGQGAARPDPEVTPQLVQAVRILFRTSENEQPFRKAVRAAAAALRAGEAELKLDAQLAAPTPAPAQREAMRRRLETLQRYGVAAAMAPLMRAIADLDDVAADLARQPAYWQASAIYIRVRLQGRVAMLYEYSAALGQARKDQLPPLDPQLHQGWRLQPRGDFIDREAQKLAIEARKLGTCLACQHAGTSWSSVTGQLDVTLFGLEWLPWEK